jgi:hypothetical protein
MRKNGTKRADSLQEIGKNSEATNRPIRQIIPVETENFRPILQMGQDFRHGGPIPLPIGRDAAWFEILPTACEADQPELSLDSATRKLSIKVRRT